MNKITKSMTIVLSAFAVTAAFAQSVKLRVADSFPNTHWAVEHGIKPWMADVTAASNGAATFEYFPAEQLGKAADLLSLVSSGVVNIGYVQPGTVSEKMPLSGVLELPGLYKTSCDATRAYWKIATNGGVLQKSELVPNGVRVLFAVVPAPYQVLMAKHPIEGLDSLKGMKLRSGGGTQDITLRKFGAVPVRVPGAEVYDALSRGTIDGIVFPLDSVLVYDLQGLVKYATMDENFGSLVVSYMISESAWRGLPPAVQKAMEEAGLRDSMKTCAYVDEQITASIAKLRSLGVTVGPLDSEKSKNLGEVLTATGKDWANALDKKGKPGSDVLNSFFERK